jgi:hypothetical protein
VRLRWHVVTVPFEVCHLAVLNYHQQGLFVAAAKYLLTCFLSLLVGFYADRTARLDFLATISTITTSRKVTAAGAPRSGSFEPGSWGGAVAGSSLHGRQKAD